MHIRTAIGRSLPLLFCTALLFTACQDDNDEVANEVEGDVIGSPTAAAGFEEQAFEEIAIEITEGDMNEDGIELIEDRPTVFTIVNNDDVAYVLEIDPLVTGQAIPPGETITFEFTTPVADEYVAELMPEAGGESLDSMTVDVVGATGVPD